MFYQLVLSMQANAWTQMGKTASPLTGKVERNMGQAKLSIDMLEMIQSKTVGNLTDEEKKLLENTLYQLRMNYVEEVKKDQESGDEGQPQGESEAEKAPVEEAEKPDSTEKPEDSGDSGSKEAD